MGMHGDHGRRGSWIAAWLCACLCGAPNACRDSDTPASEPGTCVADPNHHIVRPLGCRAGNVEESAESRPDATGDVCPAGTACRSNPNEEVPACIANLGIDPAAEETISLLDKGSACRLSDPGSIDTRLLRLGFQSDAFSIDFDMTGTVPTVSWAKPAGAELVTCALFGCEPVVLSGEKVPDIGAPRREGRIANAASCIVDSFSSSSSFDSWAFQLDDDREAVHRHGECAEPAEELSRPWVSGLSLACWATSTSSVVATSNLRAFSLEETQQILSSPLETCSSLAVEPGAYCLQPEGAGLGLCREGKCAAPCVVDSDCAERPLPQPKRNVLDFEPPPTDPRWFCECCDGCGYVGTCVFGSPPA